MMRDAPCLKVLNINVEGTSSGICLPVDLFNGQTPWLRHVAIWGFWSPWSLLLLRNLCTLTIHVPYLKKNIQEPPSEVLDVLEWMPALKKLNLYYSLPSCTAQLIPAGPNPRRVVLRSLSELVIMGLANDAAYFISHLDLP